MSGVEVQSSGNSVQLVDAGDPAFPDPAALESSNGLLCAFERGGMLLTGIDMGPVTVEVQALPSSPPWDMDGWEEAVEVSMSAPRGRLCVDAIFDTSRVELPTLTSHGPGSYRVRCYASSRSTDLRRIVEHSSERYLLQAWPAPMSEDIVHELVLHRLRV